MEIQSRRLHPLHLMQEPMVQVAGVVAGLFLSMEHSPIL
jgi:hypothetical protein